jgi:hypothetical protein
VLPGDLVSTLSKYLSVAPALLYHQVEMSPGAKGVGGALAGKLAGRMRYPQLFLLALFLFLLDVLIPDLIPFIDEILLGFATVLLGSWRTRKEEPQSGSSPPMKDITPRDEASDG